MAGLTHECPLDDDFHIGFRHRREQFVVEEQPDQTLPKNLSTATTATTTPGSEVPTAIQRIAFFSNASKRSQSLLSCAFMPLWPSAPEQIYLVGSKTGE